MQCDGPPAGSPPDLGPLAVYDQVVTIGYSGGGFAAAVAAVALGADRGVSLGGWPPQGAVDLDRAWMHGPGPGDGGPLGSAARQPPDPGLSRLP